MHRRKIAGTALIILGMLMILFSGVLLLKNCAEDQDAGKASESVVQLLEDEIEKKLDSVPDWYPPVPEPDNTDMTIVEIDGYGYIGYLSVPSLELKLPVMAEWDYARLKTAPCRYYGSVKTNDLVIAGHNYTRHFGRLSELKTGDPIQFTDMDGKMYEYTVGEVEILNPGDVKPMIDSAYDLTLYTCNYSGRQRVTVRCRQETK